LRDAVVDAADTEFLLITAGNVADEGHAAAYIQSGSNGRVTVWNVDGADHTAGYDIAPEKWKKAVVDFLDRSLG
ncbi:MAG TPA: hypothetical protein VFU25_04000, partial [Ornithinibacter sp.]|nr:hypothetical protein [Ornithinibacter sp.]